MKFSAPSKDKRASPATNSTLCSQPEFVRVATAIGVQLIQYNDLLYPSYLPIVQRAQVKNTYLEVFSLNFRILSHSPLFVTAQDARIRASKVFQRLQ